MATAEAKETTKNGSITKSNSYLAPGDDLPPLLRGGLQISWPQRTPQTMSENPAGSAATKRSPLAVLGHFWRLLMAWFQAVFAKLGGKRTDASDPNSVSLSDGSQLLSGRSGSGGDGSYTMEDLPPEVLARVLALVPARQLAQCSAVCRLWRQVAAADSLWERHWERDEKGYEAGPYAEKYLRLGRRAISAHPPPLPPRLQTFAARCQLPRCVVVDAGSGYCKYGWSEQLRPQGTVPTFLEFGNIESPTLPRLKKLYSAVFNSLGAKAPQQPVIISEPLCYNADSEASRQQRRSFRQMTCEVLFDKLKVPAICSVDQAFLALTAAQMRSGIVVNIGFRNTTILPVLNGRPLRPLTSGLLALGAMRLTTVLSDLMDRAHLHYMSMFTVRTIKEELCYVAQNYDEEMDKPLIRASCDVRGEGVFDLDQQRFQAPEILFQPALCGSPQEEGLAQLVAMCMEKCAEISVADPEDAGWFQNVLLMGGSACIPGLPERLQKDVTSLVPANLRSHVRVIPPTHGPHAPWFGAKVISNLSSMPGAWCITREQYHKLGMDFVHAMSCDDD